MSATTIQQNFYGIEHSTILYAATNNLLYQEIHSNEQNILYASTRDEALKYYTTYQDDIDLIVIESDSSKLNGIDLAISIREYDKQINILLISEFNNKEEIFQALRAKVSDYLLKPTSADMLENKISDMMKQSHKNLDTLDIKRSQNHYSDHMMLLKTDNQGRIEYSNETFRKQTGYSEHTLLRRHVKTLWQEHTLLENQYDIFWAELKKKKYYKGLVILRHQDGSSMIVDLTVFGILDYNKNVKGYLFNYSDVSEFISYRKILEKRLNIQKHHLKDKTHFLNEYQRALDMGTAQCRIDYGGTILYANDSFKKMIKYKGENILKENYWSLFSCYPNPNNSEKLKKDNIITDAYTMSIDYISQDGAVVNINATYIPIHDRKGQMVETVCIHHDQTEVVSLNREIIDTQKELIYRLGEVTERRSNETGNHIKRVAAYSELLAIKAGLTEEAETIKIASSMHDIGKISIEDAILKKEGKLTDDEYKKMQEHSLIGYNLFKDSKRPILQAAAIIARDHHERWDGRGYPNGLQGEEIHIYGRIVSIADVFDALSSKRVYKDPWEMEKILSFFKENRGVLFDPKLVDLFFEDMDQILQIQKKFHD